MEEIVYRNVVVVVRVVLDLAIPSLLMLVLDLAQTLIVQRECHISRFSLFLL